MRRRILLYSPCDEIFMCSKFTRQLKDRTAGLGRNWEQEVVGGGGGGGTESGGGLNKQRDQHNSTTPDIRYLPFATHSEPQWDKGLEQSRHNSYQSKQPEPVTQKKSQRRVRAGDAGDRDTRRHPHKTAARGHAEK